MCVCVCMCETHTHTIGPIATRIADSWRAGLRKLVRSSSGADGAITSVQGDVAAERCNRIRAGHCADPDEVRLGAACKRPASPSYPPNASGHCSNRALTTRTSEVTQEIVHPDRSANPSKQGSPGCVVCHSPASSTETLVHARTHAHTCTSVHMHVHTPTRMHSRSLEAGQLTATT